MTAPFAPYTPRGAPISGEAPSAPVQIGYTPEPASISKNGHGDAEIRVEGVCNGVPAICKRVSPDASGKNASPRRLFVLSGGGMTGIDVHAGFWLALEEEGIQPAGLSGTSAGSMVAALQACCTWKAKEFAAYIRQLNDGDIRAERTLWKLRAPWLDYYLDGRPIRRQVGHLLTVVRTSTQLPLHVWATRQDGMLCDVSMIAPTLVDAVMASMAICGVFPPVELCGDEYFDGGVRANLPLPRGLAAYDEVWLLIATAAPRGYRKTAGMITRLLQNVTWLMQDQIEDTIHLAQASHPRVHILWPAFEAPRGSFRFDHSLIDKTRAWTRQWIAQHDAEIVADIIAPAACSACGRDIDPNEFAGRDAAGRPLCTACEEEQAEAGRHQDAKAAKAGSEGDQR